MNMVGLAVLGLPPKTKKIPVKANKRPRTFR